MDLGEFLWHAKRGHGECLLIMQKGNISYYKDIVKKVFLNNFAFLRNDEYRSSYACELVGFYNEDKFFLNLLWNKISRTKLEDYYTFDYLINNLYFILKRNVTFNYEKKLKYLLNKNLNKSFFTFNENNSIYSLISLILDLNMNISIKEIINQHYNMFKNSNLDLSYIEYFYQIALSSKIKNSSFINEEMLKDYNVLLNHISNKDIFDKELPFIAVNISNEHIDLLLQLLEDNDTNDLIKTNILKVILYSKKRSAGIINKLVNLSDESTLEQKSIIHEILTKTKSPRILSILNQKNIEDSFFIRLSLNNYNENRYEEIHKKILKLKIDYINSNNWFEVEKDLIDYFHKKTVDNRLLSDLKFFFKNGLSSNSRYKTAIILKKFNMLEDEEIRALKYDANYKTRKKFLNF